MAKLLARVYVEIEYSDVDWIMSKVWTDNLGNKAAEERLKKGTHQVFHRINDVKAAWQNDDNAEMAEGLKLCGIEVEDGMPLTETLTKIGYAVKSGDVHKKYCEEMAEGGVGVTCHLKHGSVILLEKEKKNPGLQEKIEYAPGNPGNYWRYLYAMERKKGYFEFSIVTE